MTAAIQETIARLNSKARLERLDVVTLVYEGRVHFVSGGHGSHSIAISCSSPERVRAHWEGFVGR